MGAKRLRTMAALVLALASAPPARAQGTQDEPAATSGPRFTPPRQLEHPPAVYPPAALAADLEASVELELSVDENGRVGEVVVKRAAGHGFDEAAVEAARRSRFAPARNDGAPVPSRVTYVERFVLSRVPRPASPDPGAAAVPAPPPAVSIRGLALARGTRAPLAGALVSAEARPPAGAAPAGPPLRFEAEVGERGDFELRGLPPGRYALVVTGAGVTRTTFEEQLGNEVLTVRYFVDRPGLSRYESVVRGSVAREEVSRQSLSTEELVKMPGTFGDALRAVENLPGVARAPFNSGLLIVRGGKPSDSRSFLAGAEVPQLYHFGGLTSVVPSAAVERVDYFAGNFGVRYGRAIAGAIEVELREGKRDRVHGYIDVNGFDGGASVEGPLGKGSFFIAARRSYVDSLLALAGSGVLSSIGAKGLAFTTAPVYYDYQGVLDQPLGGGKLRLMLLGSDDLLKLVIEKPAGADPGLAGTFSTHIFFHRVQLRWTRSFGNLTLMAQSALGYTGQSGSLASSLHYGVQAIGDDTRVELRWQLGKNLKLLLGLDGQVSDVALSGTIPNPVREGQQPEPLSAVNAIKVDDHLTGLSVGLYAEVVAKLAGKVTLTPGVRFDYFDSIHRVTLNPRLGVRYQVTPITALKLGVGLYSQEPQPPDYNRNFGNPKVRPENAIHYALALEQGIWPGLIFEATGFYKQLYDLVVPSTASYYQGGQLQAEHTYNGGEGRIFGGEFLLRQSISRWFFGWISYTLQRSERRDCPSCSYRLFDYDQTHIAVLALHAYLPHGFEAGVRFRYISGNPVTQVRAATYDADADIYVPGKYPTNESRLDAYHALDLRLDKTFTFNRWILKLYIDLTNVYNRQNPEQLQYSFDYKKSLPLTGLPFIPSFGIRGEL